MAGGSAVSFAVAVCLGTVEKANGVGLQFDDELLDDVLDGLLASRHLDGALVCARGEFALNKDVSAFGEASGHGLEAFAESDDVMPLGLLLPLVVLVLPGLLGSDAELEDGSSVWERLGFGVLSNESDNCELIDSWCFLFLPLVCLGTKKPGRLLPNQASALSGGPKEFHSSLYGASPRAV